MNIKFTLVCACLISSYVADATLTDTSVKGYILSHYHLYKKQPEKASLWQKKIAYNAIPTHYQHSLLVKLLPAQGNYAQLLELEPQMDESLRKDQKTELAFIEALEHLQQHGRAHERLIALNQKHPDSPEIALMTTQLYVVRQEIENALLVIQKYLDNTNEQQSQYLFYFLKAQLNLQLKNIQTALDAAKKSIKLFRNNEKSWLVYALLQEEIGSLEAAKKGFITFLELAGPENDILTHLVNLVFKQKSLYINSSQLEVNKKEMNQGLELLKEKKFNAGVKKIEESVQLHELDQEARLAQLNELISTGKHAHAIEVIRALLHKNPTDKTWYAVCMLMYNQDIATDQIRELFKELELNNPQTLLPALYRADMFLRQNDYNQALTCLERVVALAPDAQLKTKALYQECIIYYKQKKYALFEQKALEGHTLSPQWAPLCNLLAYYYIEQDKELPKAHALIKDALAQEPKNPHYLDTQAYAWLKEGNIEQARTLLQTLKDREPADPCIQEHYQECMKLKEKK